MHRIRHLLNWPSDRFDAMVEQLRAESHVTLHVGDPSGRSDEERRHSYDVNGQRYLSLSWQDCTGIQVCPTSLGLTLEKAVGAGSCRRGHPMSKHGRLDTLQVLEGLRLPAKTRDRSVWN